MRGPLYLLSQLYVIENLFVQCCVGVLCVRGCVYPALLDHCLAAKVVVVSTLNPRQLEALCHISNTTAVSSILHCTDVRTLLHVDVYLCAQTQCHGFTSLSVEASRRACGVGSSRGRVEQTKGEKHRQHFILQNQGKTAIY